MSSSEVLQPRYWRQPAKLFLLLYPEDGIWVPKHVGVLYVLCILHHYVHLLEILLIVETWVV